MLEFDEGTARLLNEAYEGRDFAERRRANLAALDPQRGERLVDLGAGAGHLSLCLSRAVGPSGAVIAVDPSPAMRARAVERLAGRENVLVCDGAAESLPSAASGADGVVALQVFEYLADMAAALRAIHAALRPGGRVVVGGLHWATLAWRSADQTRMAAMLKVWDRHLADPRSPERLPQLMRETGFAEVEATPLPILDAALRPDGLAAMMLRLIERFAADQPDVGPERAAAWAAEQRELARRAAFFFSMTHVVVKARKRGR